MVELQEDELESLEQQGGLNQKTLKMRKAVFDHFNKFIRQESGMSVGQCLVSEDGRTEFGKLFGR